MRFAIARESAETDLAAARPSLGAAIADGDGDALYKAAAITRMFEEELDITELVQRGPDRRTRQVAWADFLKLILPHRRADEPLPVMLRRILSERRPTKRQQEYMEKLRDPRWQKKKNGILERDEYSCTWCGSGLNGGRNLQVHHGYYKKGFEPWDYPDECLFTLCEHCHKQAESLKQQLFELQGVIPPQFHHHIYYGLEELRRTILHGEGIEAHPPWNPKNEAA